MAVVLPVKGQMPYPILPFGFYKRGSLELVRILRLPHSMLHDLYSNIAVMQNTICFTTLTAKISLKLVSPEVAIWLSANAMKRTGASQRVSVLYCARSKS